MPCSKPGRSVILLAGRVLEWEDLVVCSHDRNPLDSRRPYGTAKHGGHTSPRVSLRFTLGYFHILPPRGTQAIYSQSLMQLTVPYTSATSLMCFYGNQPFVDRRSPATPCSTRLQTRFSHNPPPLHKRFSLACGSCGKPMPLDDDYGRFSKSPQLHSLDLENSPESNLVSCNHFARFPHFLPELRVLLSISLLLISIFTLRREACCLGVVDCFRG